MGSGQLGADLIQGGDRIAIAKQTLSRELRAMNYRKLSARPRHHAKNEAAVAAFKKTSRPVWRQSQRPRLMAR